jgi:hypothetical protein
VGDDGVRLAKRHGSITLEQLRGRGVSADRLRRALLDTLDLDDTMQFDPGRIPRQPVPLAMLRRSIPEIG